MAEAINGYDGYQFHYTYESLKQMSDEFIASGGRSCSTEDERWLAVAAGYAVDLMNLSRDIPDNQMPLELIPPSGQEQMALVLGFAGVVFQKEGPDNVRYKLAKMVASYEIFTTMNTLYAANVDFDCHIDESKMTLSAQTADGERVKFDFLGRAKFAMIRSIFPEIGEEPNCAILIGPYYIKLRDAFILPLLQSGMEADDKR